MTRDATLDYAIGDLARVRLRVPGAGRLRRALLNSKFAALAAPLPAGQAADVEMWIGPFSPDLPPECRVIDKDFWIAPNYLWFRGERGRGATEITGLDGGAVRLRHRPYGESLVGNLSRGLRGVNLYLEPMLGWWLRQRGVSLLHAGAVAVAGGAVLVCGANGAGKTRLILEWCLRHGGAFLGDDLVLLRDGGTVLPLPEHAQVLGLRAAAVAAGKAPSAGRLALLRRLWSGAPAVMPPGWQFGAAAPLRGLVLAEATPRAGFPYRLQRADSASLWRSALRLEQLELVKNQRRHRQLCNLSRLLLAYEYAFPGSAIVAAMLGVAPAAPPACLADLPAWRLELGAPWSAETSAAVATAFGEATRR
jgi:hypothetical protein